jgi:Cof subfamily protein (haloacid dehalogenase superfamily)
MIQLIAIDLDGTLLNSKKEISKPNKEVLLSCKKKGIKLVITTGRPYDRVINYLKQLDLFNLEDYVITYNGGLITNGLRTKVYQENVMEESEIQNLLDYFEENQLCYNIYFESGIESKKLSQEVLILGVYQGVNISIKTTIDWKKEKIFKIILADAPSKIQEHEEKLKQQFQEKFMLSHSTPYFLEFLPKGVNKGYGLSQLAKILHIEREAIMAFGDEENDLSMLEFAGIGIAMGNATPLVKSRITKLTKSCDEDGIAYAIEEKYCEVMK